jgi:hypothetical protein
MTGAKSNGESATISFYFYRDDVFVERFSIIGSDDSYEPVQGDPTAGIEAKRNMIENWRRGVSPNGATGNTVNAMPKYLSTLTPPSYPAPASDSRSAKFRHGGYDSLNPKVASHGTTKPPSNISSRAVKPKRSPFGEIETGLEVTSSTAYTLYPTVVQEHCHTGRRSGDVPRNVQCQWR